MGPFCLRNNFHTPIQWLAYLGTDVALNISRILIDRNDERTEYENELQTTKYLLCKTKTINLF